VRTWLCLPAAAAAAALLLPARASAATKPCKPRPLSAAVAPLTDRQCVRATEIATRDAFLRDLLRGNHATFLRPEAWGGCGPRGIIGAVIEVRPSRPLNVASTRLPAANFPSESEPGYGGCSYTLGRTPPVAIRGAKSLRVFVEFKRAAVVWVIPECTGVTPAPPRFPSPPAQWPPTFC
jgi:hypothetical protein